MSTIKENIRRDYKEKMEKTYMTQALLLPFSAVESSFLIEFLYPS